MIHLTTYILGTKKMSFISRVSALGTYVFLNAAKLSA